MVSTRELVPGAGGDPGESRPTGPVSDIVDRIDQLVDAQLAQEPTGYDHSIGQRRCIHCGEDEHSLPVTARMREMRARWQAAVAGGSRVSQSVVDELDAYRYAADESEVWCPGGDFVGPPRPRQSGYRYMRVYTLADLEELPWRWLALSYTEFFTARPPLPSGGDLPGLVTGGHVAAHLFLPGLPVYATNGEERYQVIIYVPLTLTSCRSVCSTSTRLAASAIT